MTQRVEGIVRVHEQAALASAGLWQGDQPDDTLTVSVDKSPRIESNGFTSAWGALSQSLQVDSCRASGDQSARSLRSTVFGQCSSMTREIKLTENRPVSSSASRRTEQHSHRCEIGARPFFAKPWRLAIALNANGTGGMHHDSPTLILRHQFPFTMKSLICWHSFLPIFL